MKKVNPMSDVIQVNTSIWETLYSNNRSVMSYPNDPFVRISYRLLSTEKHKKVLEIGFGSGTDMLHLLKRGFDCSGVEVSLSAIQMTQKRIQDAGYQADLRLLENGNIPFEDDQFDAVVAWQVLYYNDWESFWQIEKEIHRVLKPGGIFMGTMPSEGDISQINSTSLGNCIYESSVPGQEGAKLLIVGRDKLSECFPGQDLRIGKYTIEFESLVGQHWVVVYEKK